MATILLIEDDEALREGIRDGLAASGHRVIATANGVEGMARFGERRPDLVITDIVMREKEGIEVLLTIKRQAARVPVIVISGRPEYLAMSSKLGATQALAKPFRLPQLLACIETALAG